MSKDDYGLKLVSDKYNVICLEAGYMVFENGNKEKPVDVFMVDQTEDGIDKENRIEKFREQILKYLH